MKTEKRFYIEGSNIDLMAKSNELREFAVKLGYSDFEVSEKDVNFLEDGDKIIISYCVGGSEDDDGIHTGGDWIDVTGKWEQGLFDTGTFKSDCGKYELSIGADMAYNGFPYKNVRIVHEETEKYRFETGSLYEYDEDSGSYIHCFIRADCNTKAKAIKAYEEYKHLSDLSL